MIITLTEEQYQDAEDQYIGYCIECGGERDSCEPDARNYSCEDCGKNTVFGVPELLLMGALALE